MLPRKKITEEDVHEMQKEIGGYFPGVYNIPVDLNQYRLILSNSGILLTICPRCKCTAIHKIPDKKKDPEFIIAEWNPEKYLRDAKDKISPMKFRCVICGSVFEVKEIESEKKDDNHR